MKLLRIGVANFRSIGAQPVMIDLRKRINLLIGANNAGKSNVVTILRQLRQWKDEKLQLTTIDRHRRDDGREMELVAELERTSSDEFPNEKAMLRFSGMGRSIRCVAAPFDGLDYQAFAPYLKRWQNATWSRRPSDESLREEQLGSGVVIARSLGELMPVIETVPEFRQIIPGEYNLKGTGVVELLAHWKSPDIGSDTDRIRFQKLEKFLRELLGMEDISLDVARKSTELIVERTGLRLPLKNYGTGIHQLIILAIAVLARENAWIAIEEPEIHLHPLLQKAFLRFLIEKTNNHYILTTHSNAFLSRPQDSHIVHLWLEDGETKNREVETTGHILQVLGDLGIRAADILQSNFVIWVEGPSDRIYLNHWLHLADAELVEGIDYSIMFYGGRLLAHLSMERGDDDLTTEELIKLLRINQHSAILIDSDCANSSDTLNETKTRIRQECENAGVFCWVSEGREVENYLEPASIAAAYKEQTGADRELKLGKFQKIDALIRKEYEGVWKEGLAYEKNKVGWARRVIGPMTTIPERFDLRQQIEELVRRIHAAR